MCGTATLNPSASPGIGATASQAAAAWCPPLDWIPNAITEEQKNVAEIRGERESPDVVRYMSMNRYGSRRDDNTSWCGSFVAWVLSQTGRQLSNVSERALTRGRPSAHNEGYWPGGIRVAGPIYGAIAVKNRGRGQGHVTLVMGRDADDPTVLHCLGGNQNQ